MFPVGVKGYDWLTRVQQRRADQSGGQDDENKSGNVGGTADLGFLFFHSYRFPDD